VVVDSWAADETKEELPVPLTLAALVFVGPRREVRPLTEGQGAVLSSGLACGRPLRRARHATEPLLWRS
jgi:hypothetical protein